MIKVAFVCLGNICRSPMAEFVFKDLIKKNGQADEFIVTSFGTSDEEEGNGIYHMAKRTLNAHGIDGEHIARRITANDIQNNDYVLAMEERNVNSLLRISKGEYSQKIKRLCDYTKFPRDVADPWYTRDFEKAYNDIYDGCSAFLEYVNNRR